MDHEFEYRAIFAVDIEHSAGRGNVALGKIREVLSTALRESVARSGIEWQACRCDDLGDGFRVTAPAGTPKPSLLHPLSHELAIRLHAHNRLAGPATRVRVRIALHAGDVRLGRAGEVTGRPLEVLARLLDAPPARAALAKAPPSTPAIVVVSQHFYDETVRHGYPGIDPDTFHEADFTVKEHTGRAWLHLVGSPEIAREPERRATKEEPASTGSTMINKASRRGVVYATQNGAQHIHGTEG